MDLLENLNENQRDAVLTCDGPIMVMAGAGSGKTGVLTRKIAYLIEEKNVSPYKILALTFTNKAAREMKERVEKFTGLNTNSMWISTFHSFCARFLRLEIECLNTYTSKFQIIDEDDSEKIIRESMKELNIDPKAYKSKVIHGLISDEKNGQVIKLKDIALQSVFNKVKTLYNERLVKDNLLDFDDLILVTLKIVKEHEDILQKYQFKFEYILVDEFQDTNKLQYELVKLLALKNNNIFIVGDEDQSIYSFRGANIENIYSFKQDFDPVKVILLEQNYRSTKPILDVANNVIRHNNERIEKNLYTTNTISYKPKYYKADGSYNEESYIVEQIKKLLNEGYTYKDFAIIYRSNYLSRAYEEMLRKNKIPYEIYGGISFFSRKEIKDICAYLRLIVDHNDNFSFERIVNEPKRKIGNAMVDKLKTEANLHNCSLFEAIDYLASQGNSFNSLIDFKFTIIELHEDLYSQTFELETIIDKILDKTGYKTMLSDLGDEGKDKLDNVYELKSMLTSDDGSANSKEEKLKLFLENLALMTDMDDKDASTDKVKLMTYHQSKGLEFRAVFMPAMENGIFPNANTQGNPKEEAEERRICYVGITRARERLFLTSCGNRIVFGQRMFHEQSPYIEEMGLNNLDIEGTILRTIPVETTKTNKPVEKKSVELVDNSEIKIGDNIHHEIYGDGRVVEDNGKIISVAFSAPTGIKKLLKNHPTIRKI